MTRKNEAQYFIFQVGMSATWSSPTWRWGSAVGDAHDKAMQIRAQFNTKENRSAYLQRLKEEGVTAIEELKLTLALTIQWSGHAGVIETNGCAWREIETNLVNAKYVIGKEKKREKKKKKSCSNDDDHHNLVHTMPLVWCWERGE